MDKYIGRLLDNRYEILEVIGTGGMAVVYKARCHRLNRLVAIKILKDDYLQDEDFRRRFHVESQAVAMLSHPNIVSVYDVSTSIMADYIVMELIEGITLKQYMEKKGFLNWKETLHFAMQIGKALEHAHSRGIVHRDIKPHNVMVLKNGSVKVTDFGIARMMSKGNTLTKEALGSVHYISPEQAKGGRVDSRSDIYSLGVVMYEMMSGRPPYDGESPVSVAIQHINGGAVMPSLLNPNIPGGLEQIIMKAMAHELEDRYESATQMLRDMDEFRKDPAMLFDYNAPPLDAVTKITPPPTVLPERRTHTPRGDNSTARKRAAAAGGTVAAGTAAAAAAAKARKPQPRRNPDRSQELACRRQKEQEAEENRSRVATIAIVICSLVAVIAIGVFLAILLAGGITAKEERVEVPYLLGQNIDDLPEYEDFIIDYKREHDDHYPAGQIMEQKPEAGQKVVKGTRIVLKVSRGPAPVPVYMDDLTGLSEDRATEILNNLQLNLKVERMDEHSELEVGKVVATEPAKSTELVTGQTVTLKVSIGPEVKNGTMPNLVGQNQMDAADILDVQNLNLVISVEEVFHSTVGKGKVVSTEPAKGEQLQTGMNVKLLISKGPELKMMPDLVNKDVQEALSLLEKYGFKNKQSVEVYSDKPVGTVVGQSHKAHEEYDANDLITIEVSKGPEPTEPPTQPSKTMDVVIDLHGHADTVGQYVTITREGQEVFNGEVEAGTHELTLPDQTGSGTVYYDVEVEGVAPWQQPVVFS